MSNETTSQDHVMTAAQAQKGLGLKNLWIVEHGEVPKGKQARRGLAALPAPFPCLSL